MLNTQHRWCECKGQGSLWLTPSGRWLPPRVTRIKDDPYLGSVGFEPRPACSGVGELSFYVFCPFLLSLAGRPFCFLHGKTVAEVGPGYSAAVDGINVENAI